MEVLDDAAISFTKNFYIKLLEKKTICEAFKLAKESVAFLCEKHEAEKF